MLLRDKVFCVVMVLLALLVMCATVVWDGVKVWPEEWLVKRAWWGDKAAMDEMWQRALADGDMDSYHYWNSMRGELGEQEILFMDPSSREVFALFRKVQGLESPLLDVVVKK